MFKKMIVCSILAALTPAALAANNVDLKVSGNIAPVACNVNLGGNGIIDYGNISPDLLSNEAITKLEEKQLPLEISCEAPIKFALKSATSRPYTAFGGVSYPNGSNFFPEANMLHQNYFYGLGKTADGARVGGYALSLEDKNASADGKKVFTIGKHPEDTEWTDSSYGKLIYVYKHIVSWSDKVNSDPIPIKTLNTLLRVQAYIAYKNTLDISKPIKLDGMSSIELVYL